MTIKEAILRILEDNVDSFTYMEVFRKIKEKKYIELEDKRTPENTISSVLVRLINQNDSRVKRVKREKGSEYYWAKHESKLNISEIIEKESVSKKTDSKDYKEKDLHILLSSYLKHDSYLKHEHEKIYSKTIPHEESAKRKDGHQKWIHPDMVGIEFLELKNHVSNSFLKEINKSDTFNLISYELKKTLNTDDELKKSFFQAVSNSSWANYGYLVAFEINNDTEEFKNEMKRLNQSFGIGVIKLKGNPFQSKVLHQPKFRKLDFKTIDKLCGVNTEFEKFIENTEKILTAGKRYRPAVEKEFEDFCDKYFEDNEDSEIKKYCQDKNIPYEEEEENV